MDLLTYISNMSRRRLLAQACKCSPHYLYQIATGRRRASPDLAELIEEHSGLMGPERVAKEPLVFRPHPGAIEPARTAAPSDDPDADRIVALDGA